MTIADRTDLDITRLAGALGAEVRGIDLGDHSDDVVGVIEHLLRDHKVLFLPDQHLEPSTHVALGRRFGPLAGHPNLDWAIEGFPEIFQLEASTGGIADEWHTDLTFLEEPSKMSILNMVECPEVGGDTCWSNLELAYEGLSDPIRELCDGLTALHDAHPHNRAEEMAIHPVVRVHPETRRRSLYVNQHFTRRIVELSAGESDALLGYLTTLVTEPRFTVRYRWSKGTVGIWDNRCTQHYVLNDFDAERIIQRVTVMGDRPTGDEPRWQPWPGIRRSAVSRFDRQLRNYHRRGAAD